MAVNYMYANPIGYFTETQKLELETREYKVSMLRANCLWAELYFFRNEQNEEMQQFVGFYHDLAHLKKNIADGYIENRNDYHFYASTLTPNTWKAVELLVKAGKHVTIENHGNGLYMLPEQEWTAEEFNVKAIKETLESGYNVSF